jgi:hypothetical protein
MSHNNKLTLAGEQDWRDTLVDLEPTVPEDFPEPAVPDTVPWLGCTDAEFLDELEDHGRR